MILKMQIFYFPGSNCHISKKYIKKEIIKRKRKKYIQVRSILANKENKKSVCRLNAHVELIVSDLSHVIWV